MRFVWCCILLAGSGLLSVAILGCRSPTSPATEEPSGPPWFAEVGKERGLNFVHDAGPVGKYFFPQIMGSGAAFLDFNADGRLDIYLVNNGGPDSRSVNRLYRQEPDGKFKDVSTGSGLDITGYGMGVAVGDVNNDDRVDVLVTEYRHTRLFLNMGNGTFRDITQSAGLDNPLWGSSAAFLDFDRDGWLDLVLVNYVHYDPSIPCGSSAGQKDYCGPQLFPGAVSKLYRNLGSKVTGEVALEDVTVSAGLGRSTGAGLGVVCADFNGDRWPDIFVANDQSPNHLWINQTNGTFKEEAVQRGVAFNGRGAREADMGVALGDVNHDGHFDLFATHLIGETHTLWKQGPRGHFQDQTVSAGLASPAWRGTGFGTAFADFDRDGNLDLVIVNGAVARGGRGGKSTGSDLQGDSAMFWSSYQQQNQVFTNDGTGKFQDLSPSNEPFSGLPGVYRGLALGDIDNDGALDLLVTGVAEPARLFRNVAPNRGHWLVVRAFDPRLKRDAIGAEVTVFTAEGQHWRLIAAAYSYLCSNDLRAHFGLGKATRVEKIHVLWPDGDLEVFPAQQVDQRIVLSKGEGRKP